VSAGDVTEVTIVSGTDTRSIGLDPSVRIEGGDEFTYMFFGSGQVVGPDELTLTNDRGRRVTLVLEAGRVRLVEDQDR